MVIRKGMEQKLVFKNFVEAPLNFYPTYKYDIGTSNYDTGRKQRPPAWTDRILYVERGLECLEYSSEDNIQSSDHRPVYATFLADVEGFSNIERKIDTDRSSEAFLKVDGDFESPAFTQESQVCTIA